MSNPFEVYQIINLIDSNLPKNKIQVKGEVSDIKMSHGNMYFTLKDKYSSIKCILWKNNNNINNSLKHSFVEGDNVIFEVKINLYKSQGNLNLIIDKIIKVEGVGLLYNLYNQYKLDFENKGYFDNKKSLPLIIKKILLITSNTGAAIQDFMINIQNNNAKLDIEILDVVVQGNNCPNDIINKLSKYNIDSLNDFDLLLITRGGGSYEDLFGFSKPELIEYIYDLQQKLDKTIICSAIGHQIDNPLLDLVSDISVPTPSLASQLIIDINKKYLNILKMEKDKMKNILMEYYYNYRDLEKLLEKEVKSIINIKDKMKEDILNMINNQLLEMDNYNLRLSLLMENIKLNNDYQILIAKKNLLEIMKNGKYDKIIRLLSKNKKIKIKIEDKEIVIYDYKYI